MTFCWTAWQPYRLSYILGLFMSFFYLPKDHFLKFWWKNVQNWWIWKIDFFWNNKIPVFKIQKKKFFWLNPVQMSYKFLGIMDWIQFLWLVWFPSKKLGVCNNMRHPVLYCDVNRSREVWLSSSCLAVARQLLGSCLAVARQLLGSCLAVARQLLRSWSAVDWQSCFITLFYRWTK